MAGRKEELDVIGGAIGNSSGSAGIAIVGALGVGKTRLARDAVAKFSGCSIVHWAAGSSAAKAIPLGAFVNWLPPDVDDLLRATNHVIASLVEGPSARDCIVVVDYAHLLDDTSAFVLQRVIERRLARVVPTVCSGVAASDAVSALWRDDSMRRLDLQPLGRGDFAALLQSVLDGPMDPVTERKLWQLTRGNACFLRHIVEQEFNAGRIRRSGGTWLWLPGAVVPSPVCELVEHQMGELPDAVVDTVDLLSVAESLTLRMLVDLVGHEAIEEAEKRALIIVSDGDEPVVRLAHPLFGAVRQLKAGRLRLRRLRGWPAREWARPTTPARYCAAESCSSIPMSSPLPTKMVRASEAALWRGDPGLRCGLRKRRGRQMPTCVRHWHARRRSQ